MSIYHDLYLKVFIGIDACKLSMRFVESAIIVVCWSNRVELKFGRERVGVLNAKAPVTAGFYVVTQVSKCT